jgi:hypothetical protein
MEQGFIADSTEGGSLVSKWVAGPPVKSIWTGTKVTEADFIRIGTFRCKECGFLESYARPEFAAK